MAQVHLNGVRVFWLMTKTKLFYFFKVYSHFQFCFFLEHKIHFFTLFIFFFTSVHQIHEQISRMRYAFTDYTPVGKCYVWSLTHTQTHTRTKSPNTASPSEAAKPLSPLCLNADVFTAHGESLSWSFALIVIYLITDVIRIIHEQSSRAKKHSEDYILVPNLDNQQSRDPCRAVSVWKLPFACVVLIIEDLYLSLRLLCPRRPGGRLCLCPELLAHQPVRSEMSPCITPHGYIVAPEDSPDICHRRGMPHGPMLNYQAEGGYFYASS